jgi:TonB family protein
MSLLADSPEVGEIYSVREIARAASVSPRDVTALIDSSQVATLGGGMLLEREAVRAMRILRGAGVDDVRRPPLFSSGRPAGGSRLSRLPFAASTALHAGFVLLVAVLTTLGLEGTARETLVTRDPARLVFLAIPGPGGGGGGGGYRRPDPPARAELKGPAPMRSPVRTERRRPAEKPAPEPPRRPDPRPVERPVAAPIVEPAPPVPPVEAPVAPSAADPKDQPGVPEAPAPAPPSEGPGSGGGSGTGQGSGMGEGRGSGVGPGEGGGTGGGPYRPGSGITPPTLLREVKPQYTEEARRLGVAGDVVLEIVVRADGSVGQMRIVQGLGSGLDQRATEAVRQWRFSPAKRFGTPVDVLVEVAVEFKLR